MGIKAEDAPLPADASVGKRIRHARKEYGMSQRTLADRAGISTQALNHIERARIIDPRISTVMAIAAVLGVNYETLLGHPHAKDSE